MKKLDPSELAKLFKKIGFFKAFSHEELKRLAEVESFIISFKKDHVLIHEGEADDSLFVLLKGKVFISRKTLPQVKLAELNPGAVFGEISFLAKQPRSTNVIAQSDGLALQMNSRLMDILGAEMESKIKDQLMLILIRRLDGLNKAILDNVRLMPTA